MSNDTSDPLHQAVPLAETFDMRSVRQSADECVVELAWAENLCTSGGILHGGALMALADTAGAVLAFSNLPPNATGTTTIESKTNFFSAVKQGSTVTATARPLHVGRTTIVIETEIRNHEGRLVTKTTQTQAILSASGSATKAR